MEREDKKEGREERRIRDSLDLVDHIHNIAKENARATLNTEKQLMLYLQSWWSNLYNRPLKDPLLLSYTLEELLYEFYDRIEREKARYEQTEQEADKIEDEREQDNMDWAEEEERKEQEALEAAKKAAEEEGVEPSDQEIAEDIISNPENQKWMQKQLEKELAEGKTLFGEDFGEDIDEEFDG